MADEQINGGNGFDESGPMITQPPELDQELYEERLAARKLDGRTEVVKHSNFRRQSLHYLSNVAKEDMDPAKAHALNIQDNFEEFVRRLQGISKSLLFDKDGGFLNQGTFMGAEMLRGFVNGFTKSFSEGIAAWGDPGDWKSKSEILKEYFNKTTNGMEPVSRQKVRENFDLYLDQVTDQVAKHYSHLDALDQRKMTALIGKDIGRHAAKAGPQMELVFGGNIYNLEDTHEFGVFLNKYMNANGMSITPIERKKEKDKNRGDTTLTVGGDNGPPTLTIGGAPDDGSTPSPVTPAPSSSPTPIPPPTTPSADETIDLSIATGSGIDTEYGASARQKTRTIERLLGEQNVTPEQLYLMLFGVRTESREQERVTLDQNTYRVDGVPLGEYLETNPGRVDELMTKLTKEKGPELAQNKIDAIHRTRDQLGLSDEEFIATIKKFMGTEKDCVEKENDKFVIDLSKLEEDHFLRDKYNNQTRVDLDKLLVDAAREGGIAELNRLENEIKEFAKAKGNQVSEDNRSETLVARLLANVKGVINHVEDALYQRRVENQIAKLIENIDALPTGDAARILADNNVKSIRAEQKEERPLEIVIEFTDGEEARSDYKDKKGKYNKAAANSVKQAREQVVINNLQQLDATLQDKAGSRVPLLNPDTNQQSQQTENRGDRQQERTSRRSSRGDRGNRRRTSERVEQVVQAIIIQAATIQTSADNRQNPSREGAVDNAQRPEQQERSPRSGSRKRSGEPKLDKQKPDRPGLDDVAKRLNLDLGEVKVAVDSASLKPPKVDNLPSREEQLRQR